MENLYISKWSLNSCDCWDIMGNCSLWQFPLLPQCFQKTSAADASKWICLLEINVHQRLRAQSLGSSVCSDAGCQSRGCEFEPCSANILSDVWQKSLWQASFFNNGLTVFVEKQPVAWRVCCEEYWCEKTRTHMSRWTGCRDMTEELLNTGLNPNHSITQSIKGLEHLISNSIPSSL